MGNIQEFCARISSWPLLDSHENNFTGEHYVLFEFQTSIFLKYFTFVFT